MLRSSKRDRLRHVGYYLVDVTGSQELLRQVGYRPHFAASLQRLFRRFPDEIYIIGIEFVTLITVVALIMSIVRTQGGLGSDPRRLTPAHAGYPGRCRGDELSGHCGSYGAPFAEARFFERGGSRMRHDGRHSDSSHE